MKTLRMILVGVALCSSMYANAAEWYVSTSGNDSYAGTSWILAKRTIQSAVNAASANDTVWVYDGTYSSGTTTTPGYSSLNRVVLTKELTVRSLNGPEVTIIEGSQGSTAVRGVYMSAGTLSGFTVQNSKGTTGAGIYCPDTTPMTTNCIVSDNTTTGAGGGMRNGTAIDCTFSGNSAANGGGMYYGTATNCTFSGNTATEDGGGKYESQANHCTFSNNTSTDDGGGMYHGTANHCTFSENEAADGGGAYNITANHCIFSENRAYNFGGGMVNGTAESCLFVDNDANDGWGDGSGGGMYDGTAFNCTFSGNYAGYGGGMSQCVAYNCIVWGNSAQAGHDLHNTSANYTCSPDLTAGVDHNITANPLFVDASAGNYRLQNTSPCIDDGSDSTVNLATDLDGNLRIMNDTVDMGAYETTPIHYVRQNNSGAHSPYTTWATAAPTIQNAVDVAFDGAIVWVDDGTYNTSGVDDLGYLEPRVVIEKDIIVRSVNGPEVTIIEGKKTGTGGGYCEGVEMSDGTLSGFTITESWRGILCWGSDPVVTNCIITDNASDSGSGGGMIQGTAIDCTFSGNEAENGGGMYDGTATDCTFSGNRATEDGGGMRYGTANHCTFSGNTATDDGGGKYGGTANHCIFNENTATDNGGGMAGGTANNCIFRANEADGDGGGIYDGTANNCTVHRNEAHLAGGMSSGTANNCIVWGNTAAIGDDNLVGTTANHTCSPDVTHGTDGNITTDPQFVSYWDYHLQSTSPCMDAGDNTAVSGSVDLDGNPRIMNNTVDMGAYEFVEHLGSSPTHYVSEGNPEALWPYTDWATAATTIQDAVNAASSNDTVLVANGTYKVGTTLSTDTSLSRVRITKDLTVRSENGPEMTIIEGAGPVGSAVRGVYMSAGTLSGFTVTNGFATETGGGIYCSEDTLVVTNCMVSGNTAGDSGGGMSGGTANDCAFSGNLADDGGGMRYGTANDCTFSENEAGSDGGGMYFGTANHCTFSENEAGSDGGGMYREATGEGATDCTFIGNTANSRGGGMYHGKARRCTFSGNLAEDGGGKYNGWTYNCTFSGNIATERGGGVAFGIINTCTFIENEADEDGGGMYDSSARDSLFIRNMARNGGGQYDGHAKNCTFSENEANSSGGGMYLGTATNCIVWGNTAGGSGDNLILTVAGYTCTTDPLFVDAAGGNYRLQATSSCMDSGDSEAVYYDDYDLDGNTRIINGTVDMGAYELSREDPGSSPIHYASEGNSGAQWPHTSWATAAATIQAAVDTASANDTVLVASGTYNARTIVTPGFVLNNRVVITKNLTVRSQNGPDVTIIEGAGPLGSNAVRGVYMSAGTLSGFTVREGHTQTTGDSSYDRSGGGICCPSYAPVITNCIINGNTADNDGGGMYDGTANHCTISRNTADYGGGMRFGVASHCIVRENRANQDGGGIYEGEANYCTFSDNIAHEQGGGMAYSTATDCAFEENGAEDGGGMSSGTANHCTFSDNGANYQGGGMYNSTANQCIFSGNSADYGGGMCNGTANNCIFSGHSADYGGGMVNGTAINCTFSGNEAYEQGGGMYYGTATNCIVWGNTADYAANLSGTTAFYTCSPDVTHGTDGCITSDPQFVDAPGGNYRLQTISPCIDAGDNTAVSGIVDLDGNPRIINGTVDMGAYEFAGGAGGDTDTDGDGMSDADEQIAGTSPSDPNDYFRIESVTTTGSGTTLSWTPSIFGRDYSIWWAPTLTNDFESVATQIEYQQNPYTDTAHPTETKGFYKVKVELK